ncbi:DUF6265 family protein [Sphingobacterium lactis]|uniref:DUF6265 family protein n=1 Tax=Sphingobacterium lactis TaxID=797291 RepID=UPI003DA5C098
MKLMLSAVAICLANALTAQVKIPEFLVGDWQQEQSKNTEHWDYINTNELKGFTYQQDANGQMQVQEYLQIALKDGKLVLSAQVLGQHNNQIVEFVGAMEGQTLVFRNEQHDFPKEIAYELLNEKQMRVRIANEQKAHNLVYNRSNPLAQARALDPALTTYDEALAKELGADEYGMKSYFFVVLKTGDSKEQDKTIINEKFKGHMANINRLVEEGKLIVAGPFQKNEDNYRGLFILNNLHTVEEVKEVLESDPAIHAGILSYSIYKWYGSAALPTYLPNAAKVSKSKF